MTVKSGVQISGGAIANEFDIRDVNAPYCPAGGSALEETAKALDIRKLRHRRSGSGDLRARAAVGPSPQRGTIAVLSDCRYGHARR